MIGFYKKINKLKKLGKIEKIKSFSLLGNHRILGLRVITDKVDYGVYFLKNRLKKKHLKLYEML